MADTGNVIYGRNFKLYTAAYNSTVIPPANTVQYGTDWGTPSGQTGAWTESGYTDGGLNVSAQITRGEIRVDQELDPIFLPATGRDMRMGATLAEFTPANIKAATGQGTITSVAATTATRGYDDLDISGTITDTYIAVGYDIGRTGDEAFRIFMWKGLPTQGFQGAISSTDKATVQFETTGLPDSLNSGRVLKIRDISPISA